MRVHPHGNGASRHLLGTGPSGHRTSAMAVHIVNTWLRLRSTRVNQVSICRCLGNLPDNRARPVDDAISSTRPEVYCTAIGRVAVRLCTDSESECRHSALKSLPNKAYKFSTKDDGHDSKAHGMTLTCDCMMKKLRASWCIICARLPLKFWYMGTMLCNGYIYRGNTL